MNDPEDRRVAQPRFIPVRKDSDRKTENSLIAAVGDAEWSVAGRALDLAWFYQNTGRPALATG